MAAPVAGRPWFKSTIATTSNEILNSSCSAYHIVDFSETLREVIYGSERRYAVVALPCVAKAIRQAQLCIPKLKKRVPYILGLACGGHRNLKFSDILTGLMGGGEDELRFRSKDQACEANDFCAQLGDRGRRVRFRGLFGFLWLNGVGELKSCLFCDDIFAEVADGTFMDAWLPEYIKDPTGTNLIISRNETISRLLRTLFENNIAEGEEIDPDKIRESQAGVIHKKRFALASRCEIAGAVSWVPSKRNFECSDKSSDIYDYAKAQLDKWHKLRQHLAAEVSSLNRTHFFTSLRAWKACLKLYFVLRRFDPTIYNGKAVFFLQSFHPRAAIRKIFSPFKS